MIGAYVRVGLSSSLPTRTVTTLCTPLTVGHGIALALALASVTGLSGVTIDGLSGLTIGGGVAGVGGGALSDAGVAAGVEAESLAVVEGAGGGVVRAAAALGGADCGVAGGSVTVRAVRGDGGERGRENVVVAIRVRPFFFSSTTGVVVGGGRGGGMALSEAVEGWRSHD